MRYFLSGRCVRLPKRKINFAHRKKRLRGLERPVIVLSPTLPQPYALNIIAEFDFSADFELTLWLTLVNVHSACSWRFHGVDTTKPGVWAIKCTGAACFPA